MYLFFGENEARQKAMHNLDLMQKEEKFYDRNSYTFMLPLTWAGCPKSESLANEMCGTNFV